MAAAVAPRIESPGSMVNVAGVVTPRPVLLVTTVDIGDGKNDTIEYRKGDDAAEVARLFVAKHGLPPAITLPLAQHILDNLKQALKVKQQPERSAGRLSPSGGHSGFAGKAGGMGLEASAASVGSGGVPRKSNPAVFNRLYSLAEAQERRAEERRAALAAAEAEALAASRLAMSWISAEMMRERGPGPYDNYGEMLYAEGLDAAARRQAKAAQVKAERAVAEVSGVTFKPEISAMARQLYGHGELAPAWQRLSNGKKSKTQERLESLRREKEAAETSECTFQPRINARSDRLMAERTEALRARSLTAHTQLFQDAVRRQAKQAEFAHWCPEEATFQPLLCSRPPRGVSPSSQPLVERLYEAYYRLQAKLGAAREALEGGTDPASGRRLYHPVTGRGPTNRSPKASSLEAGLALYEKGQEARQAAAAKRAAEEVERRAAALVRVNTTSAALFRKLQTKRFRQIFKFLDTAGAGQISLTELLGDKEGQLEELNDEVRADVQLAARIAGRLASARAAAKRQDSGKSEASTIFMPPPDSRMIRSLNKSKSGASSGAASSAPSSPRLDAAASNAALSDINPNAVTFEVFTALMEEALAVRRGPREYLAPSPPPAPAPEDSFHPKIAERSKQLAARLRPAGVPVYEVLYKEGSAARGRLEAKRVAAQAAVLAACTFTPHLVADGQGVKEGPVMKALRGSQSPGSTGWSALEGGASSSTTGEPFSTTLQQLAAHLMTFDALPGEEEAGGSGNQAAAAAAAAAAAVQEGVEEEEEEEVEEQQLTALAEEVAAMMEATEAVEEAAAALEGEEGDPADQQYLTHVLGLAQAQADAMEPVLSQLVGRAPSMRSAAPAPDSPTAAAATPGVSTFVVSGRSSDAGQEAGAAEAGAAPLAAEEVERMVTQLNQEIEQLLSEVEGAAAPSE